MSSQGNDVSGQDVYVWLDCYSVYCNPANYANDYMLNITTWPADNGVPGDWNRGPTLLELYDGCTFGPPNQNCDGTYTYWSQKTGTFTVSTGQTASVNYMCDYGPYSGGTSAPVMLCSYGSYATVTLPDGTVDTYNSNPGSSSPTVAGIELAQYTGMGTYTVDTYGGAYGYGHLSIQVIDVTPAFPTVSLTTTTSYPNVDTYGVVGATDLNDYFMITVPADAFANITLDWDQNVDLDLRLYTDSTFQTLWGSSLSSQPELIDMSSLGDNITVYAKVTYYAAGSTDSASGYKLTLNLLPTVYPPCWFQDDGNTDGSPLLDGSGAGDAADGTSSFATSEKMNMTGHGTFTGMLCDNIDEQDWYSVTIPAYHGAWVKFNWTEITPNDNMMMYLYMNTGSTYGSYVGAATSSTQPGWGVATTNESYTWNSISRLPVESELWIKIYLGSLQAETEFNYTVEVRTYNQSADLWNHWDDAGSGMDGGNSSFTVSSSYPRVELDSVNNTYIGYAHDYHDRYDSYEIYVPVNYGLHVTLTAGDYDDFDLYIKHRSSPTSTGTTTIASETGHGGYAELWGHLSHGGQIQYIMVYANIGGGAYTLEVEMMTEDNDPNPEDDCGLGVDASPTWAAYLSGVPYAPYTNTWMNTSTQVDANGDADDAGGICRGWLSDDWDTTDWFHILVPTGKYLMVNATFNGGVQTSTIYMRLHMCPHQQYLCNSNGGPGGIPHNPPYYISSEASGTPASVTSSGTPLSVHSSLWPVAGGYATLRITCDPPGASTCPNTAEFIEYDLDIQFRPLSELPGGVQNDGGSGADAGPFDTLAVHIDPANPDVVATDVDGDGIYDMLNWTGWNHNVYDSTDRYSFDVPVDYGYNVCVNWDGIQYYNGGYNSWQLLDIDTNGQYAGIPNPYSQNPVCWNSSSQGYFGGDVNHIGVRNWLYFVSYHSEVQYSVNVTFFTMDSDGDTWYDDVELDCGTDPYNSTSVPQDTDADGICDALDTDTDGDGIVDSQDDFPLDPDEWNDNDGDGLGDNNDDDLDNDGWLNDDEILCVTDPMSNLSVPLDFDNDSICDVVDTDDDNDGVEDSLDLFPYDASEWSDHDGDGVGDNADEDDDNDGYTDSLEVDCSSDPYSVGSIPTDQDLDGTCDALDTDVDGDGYDNDQDLFPLDPSEWADFDLDGFGDNVDTDDDNDGVLDTDDAFPMDSSEWIDTDGDNVGDNADINDDGDAWKDADEEICGSDSLDPDSVPADYDDDGVCDKMDSDDDGDGWEDTLDAFPYDAAESQDYDGDGIGDFTDTDDDNDGWLDSEEPNCGTDPLDTFSVPDDNDRDHQCDIVDPDDDNDGTLDVDDDFPMNPAEQNDLDGDGIGDNADNDDDNDDWLDITEAICAAAGGYGDPNEAKVVPTDNDPGPDATAGEDGEWGTADDTGITGDLLCDAIDPDWDNDGFPNPADPENPQCNADLCEDEFPRDPNEWHDANGDGLGDRGTPLTFMDDFQADPMPFIAALLAIIGVVVIARRGFGGEDEDDFDEDADYTEEFMDDDELDEAIDEAFDDEEDEDED